ncbi:putative endonuclease and reverse transcriptase-like protein, partial [Operophtera brumata]
AGRTAASAPYSQPVAQPDVQEVRALANDPTERGASLPSRGRRNRRGGKKRRKPVASSTPLPLTAAPVRPARTPMVEARLEPTPYQQPAQAPPQPQMQPQRQMQPQPQPQPYQVPTYPESPSALFRDTPAPTMSLLQTAVYPPLPQRNTVSSTRTIAAGVPQGSCLSPALYALYTDDIPTLEGHLLPGERDVALALFADDSAYLSSSRSVDIAARRMQRLLDLLPRWLDKWRMAVNVGKTAALLVSSHRRPPYPLLLRGQCIEWKTHAGYLGVEID